MHHRGTRGCRTYWLWSLLLRLPMYSSRKADYNSDEVSRSPELDLLLIMPDAVLASFGAAGSATVSTSISSTCPRGGYTSWSRHGQGQGRCRYESTQPFVGIWVISDQSYPDIHYQHLCVFHIISCTLN